MPRTNGAWLRAAIVRSRPLRDLTFLATSGILRAHVALRIGIDIGGTFTDLVALDEATGALVDTKALSTPDDLLEGILRCVDQAGARLADCRLVIHGTTIGINALLERKGALTGLITTEGFRDVLEIGRGNFLRMYDVLYRRPASLVC